tara:strand:+ start:4526 stop:5398 length:873 start_codon:yes stop_codon:yes gene_type:complete
MKLDDIKDVLSFQAFRPDPDDSSAAIPKRLAGKKFVILNISKGYVTWRPVDKKGVLGQLVKVDGEFMNIAAEMADEWRNHTDSGWVVLSLNNRFIITLESNLSRKPGAERMIRANPRSVIGTKYDRGKRYALHHNPETSASLLLACEESMIKTVEDALLDNGLKPARICCGLFAMVEDYLRREHAARKGGSGKDMALIACCDGSVCVLVQKKGQWSELRSRSGLFSGGDIEPIMTIATPLLSGMEAGSSIVLLHDQPQSQVATNLMGHLQPYGAVDVTQNDHLWMVLAQN